MENEVFSQPGVAGSIEANYVPVRLNFDYAKTTAARYGVTALPTTVIIAPTPQGEVLDSIRGRLDAGQYLTRLNHVAMDFKRQNQNPYVQIPPAAAGQTQITAATPPTTMQPPVMQAPAIQPPAMQPPVIQPSAPQLPAGQPTITAQAPANNALLGLDGYCPVQLIEKHAWVKGDRRWGAIHEGRTYLFAGPDEQRRFFADPQRYAPVNTGNDVVMSVEQRRATPGRRQHGVTYQGHVYLFAEEATLQKFSKNPSYFANQAMQASRTDELANQQVR